MRGKVPDPNSVSGRIRAMIAEAKAPVSTSEVAEQFGITSTVASALLNQCRQRGMIRQVFRGGIGCKATPAMWAAEVAQ